MKHLTILLLFVISISGCSPTSRESQVLVSEIDCLQTGTVQQETIDGSTEIGLYLPPCYDREPNGVYPVLFLLPGFGGSPNDWFSAGLAAIADELILTRDVPPFIIVTTEDSFEDLDATFIVQQIIPYLESHYRASPRRQHRAIAGGSLGGASAYHLAFQIPELFESAGIFGNGVATGEEDNIRSWLSSIPEKSRTRVFLNVGESDSYMRERAQAMIALLDESGIEHTDIFSDGNHTYAYWLSNFPAYFRWLAQGW